MLKQEHSTSVTERERHLPTEQLPRLPDDVVVPDDLRTLPATEPARAARGVRWLRWMPLPVLAVGALVGGLVLWPDGGSDPVSVERPAYLQVQDAIDEALVAQGAARVERPAYLQVQDAIDEALVAQEAARVERPAYLQVQDAIDRALAELDG